MIQHDRKRQVIVQDVTILSIIFSGILQVGDVYGDVTPFSYGEAYGGYRGAPSFVTKEVAETINTRLHFANQTDEDVTDFNIYGEKFEMFRPNIRGIEGR